MPQIVPATVRAVERRDRDQLTELVNLHVAAVIPGVTVSVNAVLSQLEREPDEGIVDPWVAERRCLVAQNDTGIVAAALLHRFRPDADVGPGYRDTGEIRWLLCRPDETAAGAAVLDAALLVMRAWRVRQVGVDCSLPAPACYGIPDVAPHLRRLIADAGFGQAARTESVLSAPCTRLAEIGTGSPEVVRTVGRLGARFALASDVGTFVEVCPLAAAYPRCAGAERWADVGDLVGAEAALPGLFAAAARWLVTGGTSNLIDYWCGDDEDPGRLRTLHRAGFELLVRTERGHVLDLSSEGDRA